MRLVNLSTAKALQELGYDGEYTYCHVGVYPKNEYQIMTLTDCEKYRHDISILCAAPRLDDAAYWLRDKHQLSIEVGVAMSKCWAAYIYDFRHDVMGQFCEIYDDYDSALEAAVTKAIEIIKTQKQELI